MHKKHEVMRLQRRGGALAVDFFKVGAGIGHSGVADVLNVAQGRQRCGT